MRVDQVAKFFEGLSPKPSRAHDNLYTKVWSPEDYPVVAHDHSAECKHGEEQKDGNGEQKPAAQKTEQ
mgnify:CR=1 FL=1